ncbi:MAG: hypothetical protein WCK41_01880 [Actinomycetes bacterium]
MSKWIGIDVVGIDPSLARCGVAVDLYRAVAHLMDSDLVNPDGCLDMIDDLLGWNRWTYGQEIGVIHKRSGREYRFDRCPISSIYIDEILQQ